MLHMTWDPVLAQIAKVFSHLILVQWNPVLWLQHSEMYKSLWPLHSGNRQRLDPFQQSLEEEWNSLVKDSLISSL
jgi:hypothetical protein